MWSTNMTKYKARILFMLVTVITFILVYILYSVTVKDKSSKPSKQKDKVIDQDETANAEKATRISLDKLNQRLTILQKWNESFYTEEPYNTSNYYYTQLPDLPYTQIGRNHYKRPWSKISHLPWELYVLSAYYDVRKHVEKERFSVKVVIVSEKLEERRIYCALAYEGNGWSRNVPLVKSFSKQIKLTTIKLQEIGLGYDNHGVYLTEYMITCHLRGVPKLKPSHVTIVDNVLSIHNRKLVYQPVEQIPAPAQMQDFILCEKTIYGNVSPYQIIEFVELNRILGAKRIVVYFHALSKLPFLVLKHYANKGILEMWESQFFLHEEGFSSQVLHHTPVINDCMLRYSQSYEYAVVTDIDEFIIPRLPSHFTWNDLISYIKPVRKKHKPDPHEDLHQYVFRNLYFFFENPQDENVPRYIKSLRYRYRGKVSEPGYTVKSILNPRICAGMHHHYCWGQTIGDTIDVNPEDALNHHYKACQFSTTECEPFTQGTVQDNVMLKYRSSLLSAVSHHVTQLQRKGIIQEMV